MSRKFAATFTGTRNGMTFEQMRTVRYILSECYDVSVMHNGSARGADKDAYDIADELGIRVIAHPANNVKAKDRVILSHAEYREAKPALIRNKVMVDEGDFVIATPGEYEEQLRSGTWATIRYAIKEEERIGKALYIVWPDGLVN